jgi:hypothetical protein
MKTEPMRFSFQKFLKRIVTKCYFVPTKFSIARGPNGENYTSGAPKYIHQACENSLKD